MLRHVVQTRILVRLQYRRSIGMDSKGNYHYTRTNFQSGDMVAILLQPRNQRGTSMGIRKETFANFSWVQYNVDMA